MLADLVIPARNEAASVPALFDALEPLRGGLVDRVVLCDNGSTDATAELAAARGAVVVHEPRRGYGAACRRAIAWLRAEPRAPEVVAFLDADLSDDPAALALLVAPIAAGGADIVIGARVRRAERGALTLPQRVANSTACAAIHALTGVRCTDLGPFRAVRWSTLEELAMRDTTWGWTVELQLKAAMRGRRMVEVDVPYRPRRAGRSKISRSAVGGAKAAGRIAWTVASVWWRERRRGGRSTPC